MNINIIETMKQALEALEQLTQGVMYGGVQNNLRAAIDAAEKQEPIGKVVVINHPDDYDEIAVQFFPPINVAINDLVFTHPAPTQPDKSYSIYPNCKCDEHGACSYCWEGKK